MILVVKLGGEVVRGAELGFVADDLVALAVSGHRVIVVHGGGPQVTELQQKLGQKPSLVAGRRITDDAALEAMKMAVAGAVNVDLCAALLRAGGKPIGLHGASSLVVHAHKRPPVVVAGGGDLPIDMGHVGDVVEVGEALLQILLERSYIPVLACLGADEQGRLYNINADAVAASVAARIGAGALMVVTNVPGVLRDPHHAATRFSRLTLDELQQGVAAGVITRGMIPKLAESFRALREGVPVVHVVGALGPGDLRRALEQPGSVGTILSLAPNAANSS